MRTLRGLFEEVIGDGRIRAGNTVEYAIKRDLRAVGIAVLAGLDEALRFVQSPGFDEPHIHLFRRGIVELTHSESSLVVRGVSVRDEWVFVNRTHSGRSTSPPTIRQLTRAWANVESGQAETDDCGGILQSS